MRVSAAEDAAGDDEEFVLDRAATNSWCRAAALGTFGKT